MGLRKHSGLGGGSQGIGWKLRLDGKGRKLELLTPPGSIVPEHPPPPLPASTHQPVFSDLTGSCHRAT